MGLLNSEIISELHKLDLFKNLSTDVVKEVLYGASVANLKNREYLYSSGAPVESFSLVVKGAIKLIRHSPKGEDVIVHIAITGDLIGALLLNNDQSRTYPVTAKSMGTSVVVIIPKSTYVKYWRNNLNLQQVINGHLTKRLNNVHDDKVYFASPLNVRVANFLLRYVHENEQANPASQEQPVLNLTRKEIADALGVSTESIIRLMSDWHEKGIILKLKDQSKEIINVASLVQILN